MARVTTETGIANLSASLLKIDGVSSISPPDQRSKFAKAANRWYDESRRDTLAEHIWNFAEVEVSLPAVSPALSDGRYGNKFLLPTDYIRVSWVADEEIPETDYKVKNGHIFSNSTPPLKIGYIFDQEDITKYSPKFIQCFARKLAANMTYEMTGSRTLAREMEEAYIEYLSRATGVDGQESPPTHKIDRSKWRAAKEGRSMLGAAYQGRVVV